MTSLIDPCGRIESALAHIIMRKRLHFHATLAPRDRKIIGAPDDAEQREMPSLLGIVDETLPRDRRNQGITPFAVQGRDRGRRVCALGSERSSPVPGARSASAAAPV